MSAQRHAVRISAASIVQDREKDALEQEEIKAAVTHFECVVTKVSSLM